MKQWFLLGLISLSTTTTFAVEHSCWYGNFLELDPHVEFNQKRSHELDLGNKTKKRSLKSDALVAGFSLVVDPRWSVDTDIKFAKDRNGHHNSNFSYRAFELQARRLILDDLIGDPLSLSAGISGKIASKQEVRDLLQIEPSKLSTTLHMTLGKEFFSSKNGFLHLYAVGLVGAGESASSWLKSAFHAEYVIGSEDSDNQKFGAYICNGKGLGSNHLKLDSQKPYAHTNWRYTNIGASYTYSFYGYGSLAASISKRIEARSCPRKAISMTITFSIPFGL